MDTEVWMVCLPNGKYVVLANEIEARDFAEKFGGQVVCGRDE